MKSITLFEKKIKSNFKIECETRFSTKDNPFPKGCKPQITDEITEVSSKPTKKSATYIMIGLKRDDMLGNFSRKRFQEMLRWSLNQISFIVSMNNKHQFFRNWACLYCFLNCYLIKINSSFNHFQPEKNIFLMGLGGLYFRNIVPSTDPE